MAPATSTTRCLVACSKCERQFDATGLAAGSRFHCGCGAVLKVPRFRAQDAVVVRCSSCSAPRRQSAPACEHCGADYTLHEQDMHTLCPSCMTRVSDRARFCHNCAKPIVVAATPGTSTKQGCPSCGLKHKMVSRSMGDPPVSILECGRCAGVWLGNDGFALVRDHARESASDDHPSPQRGPGSPPDPRPRQGGAVYRRCPDCREFMYRKNYGGKSGVILDVCKSHGLWFDARELERVLRWIRRGGEERARKRVEHEEQQRERRSRISFDRESRSAGSGAFSPGEPSGMDVVGGILGALFDL
jgi:Zn-finger nucleic acid-binding protein